MLNNISKNLNKSIFRKFIAVLSMLGVISVIAIYGQNCNKVSHSIDSKPSPDGNQSLSDQIVFTSATPTTVGVAECSQALVVELQNSTGTAKTATSAIPINLSENGGAGEFYSDSSCVSFLIDFVKY